jgi:membrane protease YdiL (CAAX protease family)
MSSIGDETPPQIPPPTPRRFWLARMILPTPAETFGGQCIEILLRTALILPCELGLLGFLWYLGIPAGNASAQEIEEMARRGAPYLLAVGGVIGPAVEELCFRWLPSQLSDVVLRRKTGSRWWLGVSMAVLFALMHNLDTEASDKSIQLFNGLYFNTGMVPASQFLLALLLWDLMRRYGLWASAFSHMLHNFVFLSLALADPATTP